MANSLLGVAACSSANAIPTCLCFVWGAKSPPWTDGKGNQEKYKIAVEHRKEFYDTLQGRNLKKVIGPLQAVVLKAQLHRKAADQGSEVTRE